MKELTTEQLIEIAKRNPKNIKDVGPQLQKSTDHVARFIQDTNITDGDNKVPNFVLYFKYCREWQTKGGKLSKIGFLRTFSRFFEKGRTGKQRYYLLNLELDKEYIEIARKHDTKGGRRRKTTR